MSDARGDPAGDGIRIPLVEPGTRPELAELEREILAERGRISVLYRALLNSPAIASGWEKMLTAVRNRSSLAPDLREIAILRVAVLNRARYEFDAHVPHAQKAGVAQETIDALAAAAPPSAALCAGAAHLVLELTDARTRDIDVDDALMARVQARFTPQQTVDLVATIAAYNMVSRFLVALRIGH
jgi:AhpD family alkylhydroperoxidase